MSKPTIHSDMAVIGPNELDTVDLVDIAPSLTVRSFGRTDRGKVRTSNEDQFLIAVLDKALRVRGTSLPRRAVQHSNDQSHLFVVADGVGGHAGGEQASALAIDSVETFVLETFKWFSQCQEQEQDSVLTDFQAALGQANARVRAEAAEHPQWRHMGTTLTLAYSQNDKLYVAHAGDSRCYLGRKGRLHLLTSDHTLVQDMVRVGALSAEEAATHHWRHTITNAIGGESAKVKVEVHKLQLEAGDRLLLCSDGLTEMVPEKEIALVLHHEADPELACQRLVESANEAGGKDNITVIVARYEAGDGRPA